MSGSTFNLTEAKVNDPMAAVNDTFDKINSMIDASSFQPRSLGAVYTEFDKLSSVIDQLGSKVSGVLAKQENEFLGAYRAHMYNVQRDLSALRAQVVASENALSSNEGMRKIEEECEWYRRESLRLDSLLEDEKTKNQAMKEETRLLTSERNWMAKQLRAAKKQNMLLRSEIELQLREGSDANMNSGMLSTGKSSAPQTAPQNGYSREAFELPDTPQNNRSMGVSKSTTQLPSVNRNNNANALQKELRRVKNERDANKKSASILRAGIVAESTSRKELEEFFVDCISDVKKSIERRRRKGASSTGKISEVNEQLLATPVALHDFMAGDRKKVIELLLGRDEVLSKLYDTLFPQTGGGSVNRNQVEVNDEDDLATLLQYTKQTLKQGVI
jgi:hypothetical protein